MGAPVRTIIILLKSIIGRVRGVHDQLIEAGRFDEVSAPGDAGGGGSGVCLPAHVCLLTHIMNLPHSFAHSLGLNAITVLSVSPDEQSLLSDCSAA